jgi:signal transduction histidine kinase
MRSRPAEYRDYLGDRPPVALDIVKKDAIENVRGIFSKAIVRDTHWRSNLLVIGDQRLLVQVVTNLLTNAVEAALEGDKTSQPVVEIGSYVDGHSDSASVALFVEDRGPGVTKKILRHIDRPFASTKQSEEKRNRGLGFYVVARLVELHGGVINLETITEDDKPTTVAFPEGASVKGLRKRTENQGTRVTIWLHDGRRT